MINQTNKMILSLTDDQKYTLIKQVLVEYKYHGILKLLYPPDVSQMINRRKEDTIYDVILKNEQRIKQKIIEIVGCAPTYHISNTASYKRAVENRRYVLNLTFNMVINDKLKNKKMCKNGENYKCKLVGLIKHTIDYQIRNEAKCNENSDGSCVITPTQSLSPGYSIEDALLPSETYKDVRIDTREMKYYKTCLDDHEEGLVHWNSTIDEQPDDEEILLNVFLIIFKTIVLKYSYLNI